jgi:hypothetical protein
MYLLLERFIVGNLAVWTRTCEADTMSERDAEDLPILTIEISTRECTDLLRALWNNYRLVDEPVNTRLLAAGEFERIELGTVTMQERYFNLVRKLGGDPSRNHFGLE